MEKKDFTGDLKKINPKQLIPVDPHNKLDDLFLMLAIIHNDLKGILLFGDMIKEFYRKPPNNEISAHAGEHGGLYLQRYKLAASVIHEFFDFLKKNEEVVRSPEFSKILNRCSSTTVQMWRDLESLAFVEKVRNKSPFAYSLFLIRNKIGFHYDNAMKLIRRAYFDFFDNPTLAQQKFAYYSIGSSLQNTRFYYADAATQQYIFNAAEIDLNKELSDQLGDFEKHTQELSKVTDQLNITLHFLLESYIKSRH